MSVPDSRNCLHCKRLFDPDYRHRGDQFYCAKPACKKVRQAASRRRWRERPENQQYWCGPENIERVQAWRAKHPQYWKRGKRKPEVDRGVALQNAMKSAQTTMAKRDKSEGNGDCVTKRVPTDFRTQDPVLVGLIAQLTGDTLQNAIHQTTARLYERGQAVMGRQLELRQ
jgi:hypothetical protein